MSTLSRRRTAVFAVSLAVASSTSIVANAAPNAPASATGCASNVCIYVAGNAGGTVLVQAWARTNTFTGYFRLTGPGSVNQVSPNQQWRGSKGNYWSTSVGNAPGGTYCITGNPSQGTACEGVS